MTDTGKTMHARVIRASAGTGKTTRIVSEITERLMKGLAPDQLIAVTFTEKAAAELIGYSPAYMRHQASRGLSPLPFVKRGNRRLYRVADIKMFVTETA